jgi:hypothetical protein
MWLIILEAEPGTRMRQIGLPRYKIYGGSQSQMLSLHCVSLSLRMMLPLVLCLPLDIIPSEAHVLHDFIT